MSPAPTYEDIFSEATRLNLIRSRGKAVVRVRMRFTDIPSCSDVDNLFAIVKSPAPCPIKQRCALVSGSDLRGRLICTWTCFCGGKILCEVSLLKGTLQSSWQLCEATTVWTPCTAGWIAINFWKSSFVFFFVWRPSRVEGTANDDRNFGVQHKFWTTRHTIS